MDERYQRKVADSLLQLEFEVWGEAPVQAIGTMGGREFYFRSRHTGWTLEVANETGDLPTDVGMAPVFFREGQYDNASYMPLDKAVSIIKRCALEYITTVGRPA
jgi:hypothetical protein